VIDEHCAETDFISPERPQKSVVRQTSYLYFTVRQANGHEVAALINCDELSAKVTFITIYNRANIRD